MVMPLRRHVSAGSHMKIAALGCGSTLAVLLSIVALTNAGAAPVNGPSISAPTTCIRYGASFAVAGDSFAPDTQVIVSAPLDRYVPPGTAGAQFGGDNRAVTTSASGAFKVRLTAPQGSSPGGARAVAYQPRGIYAYVTQQPEANAYVLVGTATVCRELQRLSKR